MHKRGDFGSGGNFANLIDKLFIDKFSMLHHFSN